MKIAVKKMRSPLKVHGGKSYLARRIVNLFPEHKTYVEPFAGGLSCLLNKPESEVEVAGDLDAKLMIFWEVLACRDRYLGFADSLSGLDYDRETFERAKAVFDDARPNRWEPEAIVWMAFAAAYLVRNRFSRGGLGKDFAWSDRLRGGQPGDKNAWDTIRAELPAIHRRARDVRFVPGPAVAMIGHFDSPDTLIYCDPPYLHSTRTHRTTYAHEMTESDHRLLLTRLKTCQAKVFLSGYRSELYDDALVGWKRHEWDIANHSGQGRKKNRRTEVLWENVR